MSNNRAIVTLNGKSPGITVLVVTQFLIGIIHIIFGVWLLSIAPNIYGIYTVIFGLSTLIFTAGLWLEKRWGWVGTVAVAIFVIIADTSTLLDLPSIPGIPKFAGFGEIIYSSLILLYLSQTTTRANYKMQKA
jgi:hypothetical protein